MNNPGHPDKQLALRIQYPLMATQKNSESTKPSMLQITWSMVAAFCGVQNNNNHERDFAYIDEVGFKPYIIIGIVLTLIILLVLYGIVQLILI